MAEVDDLEIRLFDLINKHFSLEDLKTFCFKLKVDYDNLGGENIKEAKIRELIKFAKKRVKILELEEELVCERPELTSTISTFTKQNLVALIDLYGMRVSNRFSVVLDYLEYNIHQALKMRQQRSITNEKDIKFFANVKDYWRAYERGELKKGMWIEIDGTFSEYGPLLFGAPWAKKEDHFNWRSYVSDVEAALGIDGVVSISSGNAIIRPNKVDVQNPSNGEISYNKYAGLYQYIGRNSVPIVIDEQLLLRAQKEAKIDSEIMKTPAFNVRIRGTIEEPSGLNSTITTLPARFDKEQCVLQIAGDDAFIKIVGSPDFFESDIWAVVQSNRVENMVVRCPDFSEKEAIGRAICEISNQVTNSFGSNYAFGAQFDRVKTPFGREYRDHEDVYIGKPDS